MLRRPLSKDLDYSGRQQKAEGELIKMDYI